MLSNEQKKIIRESFEDLILTLPSRVSETPNKVIADFFLSQFDSLQAEAKEELKKKIERMRQETCDCEESIGYHSKECDFGPYGFNQALDDILQILNK